MKLNMSVSKPFSLSDNSDNNGFSQQLIILHIENFRWYRNCPPDLRCFIFLYIVKLRWYRISLIQSYCKMPRVGIDPTSPSSGFRRFTTEPQLLLHYNIQFFDKFNAHISIAAYLGLLISAQWKISIRGTAGYIKSIFMRRIDSTWKVGRK